MSTLVWRRVRLAIWLLIAAAGVAAGWRQAVDTQAQRRRELGENAERCAAAFNADETRGLTGTPADLTRPAYLAAKARLARLRQISPAVRSVCLLRIDPDAATVTLLADSEPPDSPKAGVPGDAHGDAASRARLSNLLGRGQPAVDGPHPAGSGAAAVGYAAVGAVPPGGMAAARCEVLALELAANGWRREWMAAAIKAAVLVWLFLGLPFGVWIEVRRQKEQVDRIRQLSHAIEQSRSAVVITGIDQRIEFVNAGLCAITGWTREELVGQSVRMLASDETGDAEQADITQTVRAGRTWQGETANNRRDGSTYPARSVVSPVHGDDGRLIHIIAVIEDITERKQGEAALVYARERAEAGERAKGQFLAMMSHEIRTPLNGIIGFADLLLDGPLTPEQREFAVTIRTSGESLVQLTSNILDYSQIDAGRLKLEPEPASPLECVEAVLETFAAAAAQKGITLLHSVDGEVPEAVLIDAARLRQVLVNLVSNAVKFTSAGEVEVTVRREAPRKRGDSAAAQGGSRPPREAMLAFSVRDTGAGIPQAERGKLFKPFSPIDASSTRRHGGTGLGLAISRSLVQMMGGDIQVESEEGKGATFTFTIAAGGVPPVSHPPVAPDHDALQGRTLAIVTASASLGAELGRLAGSWGARMLVCTRDELAAAEWDAAVVDIASADTGAWMRVLGDRPELSSRPMVALIPFDLPAAQRDALRGGFRMLLRKPAAHHALHGLLIASLHPRTGDPAVPAMDATAAASSTP